MYVCGGDWLENKKENEESCQEDRKTKLDESAITTSIIISPVLSEHIGQRQGIHIKQISSLLQGTHKYTHTRLSQPLN